MKFLSQSSLDGFGLAVLKKGLFYGTLLITLICGALLIQLEEKYKFRPAGVAAVIVFGGGLFIAFFAVPAVIGKMKEDKALFLREAIAHTFYSYILMCAFVPVVGPFISRALAPKKSDNPFTANDE